MTDTISPWRWAVVAAFILGTGLNYLDRQLLAAVFPALRTEFHLSLPQLGAISSAFYLTYGLSAVLWGGLIDRWGLTSVLTVAVLVWSLAGIATGSVESYAGLLACRALLGFAEAVVIPASGKVFATFLSAKERSLGTAVNQLGITLGMSTAPLLAAWLAPTAGWRGTFFAAGLGGLLWIPLWLITYRSLRGLALPEAKAPQSAGSVVGDRRLWIIILANCLVMTIYGLWSSWTTLYLVKEWGMAQKQADQQLAWIPPVFATIGGLAGGWFCYRLIGRGAAPVAARIRTCLIGGVLLLLTVLLPWAPNAIAGTALISLSFFGCVFMSVNLYALPLDLFGAARAGLAIALLTGTYGLYLTVQGPLVGYLWAHGLFKPICLFSALVPLAAAWLLRVGRIEP